MLDGAASGCPRAGALQGFCRRAEGNALPKAEPASADFRLCRLVYLIERYGGFINLRHHVASAYQRDACDLLHVGLLKYDAHGPTAAEFLPVLVGQVNVGRSIHRIRSGAAGRSGVFHRYRHIVFLLDQPGILRSLAKGEGDHLFRNNTLILYARSGADAHKRRISTIKVQIIGVDDYAGAHLLDDGVIHFHQLYTSSVVQCRLQPELVERAHSGGVHADGILYPVVSVTGRRQLNRGLVRSLIDLAVLYRRVQRILRHGRDVPVHVHVDVHGVIHRLRHSGNSGDQVRIGRILFNLVFRKINIDLVVLPLGTVFCIRDAARVGMSTQGLLLGGAHQLILVIGVDQKFSVHSCERDGNLLDVPGGYYGALHLQDNTHQLAHIIDAEDEPVRVIGTEHRILIADGIPLRGDITAALRDNSPLFHVVVHSTHGVEGHPLELPLGVIIHQLAHHLSLVLCVFLRIVRGGDGKLEIHHIGAVIHPVGLGKLLLGTACPAGHGDAFRLITIVNVDPTHIFDDPLLATGPGALLANTNLVDLQLVKHVAFVAEVLRQDPHRRQIPHVPVDADGEGLLISRSEAIGGQLLVGQHITAAAVLEHQQEIELVLGAAVAVLVAADHVVSHLHRHGIVVPGLGKTPQLLCLFIIHGIAVLRPVAVFLDLDGAFGVELQLLLVSRSNQYLTVQIENGGGRGPAVTGIFPVGSLIPSRYRLPLGGSDTHIRQA